MSNVNFLNLVREYFPEVTDEEALGILWNYTGYPEFWDGDPVKVCREELAHLMEVGPEAVDTEYDAMHGALMS